MRCCSVVQRVRRLMGQPLYCSTRMLACGERKAMVVTPPSMRDSAVSPCFPGCLSLLHRHFSPQSPPSHSLNPSLRSKQQPSPWDCSTIANSSSQLLYLPGDPCSCLMHGYGKGCLSLIPFRLPEISCFTLSLKCFSSDSDSCLTLGIGPLRQFPHTPGAGPVLLILLFFPLFPSSYQV